MRTPVANPRYQEALTKLRIARMQEASADPEYLDIAIEKTNLAQKELDLVIKSLKMGVSI